MEPAFNVPLNAHMLGCTSCVSFQKQMRRFLLQQRTASGTNDIGSMTSTFLM